MKAFFEQIRQFYRSSFSHYLFITAVAFVALLVISFLVGFINKDLSANIMDWFAQQVAQLGVVSIDGKFSVIALFFNNSRSMANAILLGFIPFIYFSAISLGTNAMLIGLFAAVYVNEGKSLLTYLCGILPHGIFEIPALIIALSCGFYLCETVTDYFRSREKGIVSQAIRNILPVYLCIILPLLLLSAIVETYLTPVILQAIL